MIVSEQPVQAIIEPRTAELKFLAKLFLIHGIDRLNQYVGRVIGITRNSASNSRYPVTDLKVTTKNHRRK